jgi:hypothetical protein
LAIAGGWLYDHSHQHCRQSSRISEVFVICSSHRDGNAFASPKSLHNHPNLAPHVLYNKFSLWLLNCIMYIDCRDLTVGSDFVA